jgi:lipopolysaccharide/colanic/teichoic acid biosynthesis glycosyltransferase
MQRLLDILLSATALLVLTPLLIPISLILRFTGEGEIFYKQKRIGFNAQSFDVLKFATMLKNSPNLGTGLVTVQNDPRILPLGGFLRKSKINELPQLLNVLLGDMSLIGPRPLAPRGFSVYTDSVKAIVTTVRPGLSGVGSIAFRNEEQMLHQVEGDQMRFYDEVVMPYKGSLECWYVENQSFILYLTLILCTVLTVLSPTNRLLWKLYPSVPKRPANLAE